MHQEKVQTLRPLDTIAARSACGRRKGPSRGPAVVELDFYYAKPGSLDELVKFLNERYIPCARSAGIKDVTMWTSEITQSEFPRLPLFHGENLVITIKSFKDERDREVKSRTLRRSEGPLCAELGNLLDSKRIMVIHPEDRTVPRARSFVRMEEPKR